MTTNLADLCGTARFRSVGRSADTYRVKTVDQADPVPPSRWWRILTGETLPHIWRIPLVVGTLLTTVNQSRHILDGPDLGVGVAVATNYLCPYVVASLGLLHQERDKRPSRDADSNVASTSK